MNAIRPITNYIVHLLLVIFVLSTASWVHAEDEDEGAAAPASRYIEITPAFVTNFGGPGRLRYIKVEVTLRVTGGEGEEQVRHHLPHIKDTLLNLFAIQTPESIASAEGKEQLRQVALEEVSHMLSEEDADSYIEDLLFTSFVAHQ